MITAFVVDDDPFALKLTRLILEREGHRVIPIPDWSAVSVALACQTPNVMFVDVNMPGLSEDRLVEIIKSRGERKDLPVVLLSDLPEENSRDRADQCGADDWARKPLTRASARATLSKVLPRDFSNETTAIPSRE